MRIFFRHIKTVASTEADEDKVPPSLISFSKHGLVHEAIAPEAQDLHAEAEHDEDTRNKR